MKALQQCRLSACSPVGSSAASSLSSPFLQVRQSPVDYYRMCKTYVQQIVLSNFPYLTEFLVLRLFAVLLGGGFKRFKALQVNPNVEINFATCIFRHRLSHSQTRQSSLVEHKARRALCNGFALLQYIKYDLFELLGRPIIAFKLTTCYPMVLPDHYSSCSSIALSKVTTQSALTSVSRIKSKSPPSSSCLPLRHA